jgi:hypothetical protein
LLSGRQINPYKIGGLMMAISSNLMARTQTHAFGRWVKCSDSHLHWHSSRFTVQLLLGSFAKILNVALPDVAKLFLPA